MSRISAAMQMTGMTKDEYDKVMEDFEAADREMTAAGKSITKGRVVHVATLEDGGMFIFDVWESTEDFAHTAESLMPILQEHNVSPAHLRSARCTTSGHEGERPGRSVRCRVVTAGYFPVVATGCHHLSAVKATTS
ncbi:MAG: hypothetical protein GY798_09575 [Hyphomicrobiales bacterium]|nr:hypothetical protein [Hyphomicrobiales bacterium]